MKEVYKLKISDNTISKIQNKFKKDISEIEENELIKYLYEDGKYDGIERDTEGEYFWCEEEKEAILCTSNRGDLCWIEDLGFYTSFNEVEGNQLDTVGTVVDFYFGRDFADCDYGDTEEDERTKEKSIQQYKEAINSIEWCKEDLKLENEIEKALKDLKIEEGEDFIQICIRHMLDSDAITALESEYSEDEYEVMKEMYHYEKIYRIKNKLYYVRDDSWNFNFEYHWYFQEVGESVYEYFKFYKEGEECDSRN